MLIVSSFSLRHIDSSQNEDNKKKKRRRKKKFQAEKKKRKDPIFAIIITDNLQFSRFRDSAHVRNGTYDSFEFHEEFTST